jgi:predicted transcriptional regulator
LYYPKPMQVENILNELKNDFQLKDSHISIIKSLKEKDCTADEICSLTRIPKGKIYELLNELLNVNLIKKIRQIPAIYSAKDIKSNTLDFLKYCFDELVAKEVRIMSMLDRGEQQIEVITNKEKCIFRIMESLAKENNFRIVFGAKSVPMFFYPDNNQLHLKLRKKLVKERETLAGDKHNAILLANTYKEAHKLEKRFRFLITEEAFNLYMKTASKELSKKEFRDLIKKIKGYVRRADIDLRVMQGHIFNYIYSSNDRLFIIMFSAKMAISLVITSEKAVNAFADLFDDVFKNSKNIKSFMDRVRI